MTEKQPALNLAMTVHSELSQAISATPDTIRASSVLRNPALMTIATFALLALGGLVILGLGTGTQIPPTTTNGGRGLGSAESANVLIGAILGAAFYAFWTAREYLRDGTFNRQYSQVYLVRFGLGVVAGFILGSLAMDSDILAGGPKQIGMFTLAIVGGFSAEAVVQILQRISDILVATVRGSDKERAKADAERATAKKINETAAKLQEALQKPTSDAAKTAVQKVVRDMMK